MCRAQRWQHCTWSSCGTHQHGLQITGSGYAPLGPDEGDLWNGPVVGVRKEDHIRGRVEAIVCADLPESGAEEVRVGDAKEGQCCDGASQLEDEQGVEHLGHLPFPGDIGHFEHFGGGGRSSATTYRRAHRLSLSIPLSQEDGVVVSGDSPSSSMLT